MGTQKGRIRRFTLFMLIVGAALLIYASVAVNLEPDVLEYMLAAGPVSSSTDEDGETTYKSDLDAQLETMEDMPTELEGAATAVTLTGTVAQATLSLEGGDAAAGPLLALGDDTFRVTPRFVRAGRLFYPDELKDGDRVMLLDEQFALALFRMTDVIGREVQLAGKTYRVVGVVRHSRRVGEAGEYFAYIPLKTAQRDGIQLDFLTLSAIPVENGGAMTAFESAATRLGAGGTFYDIRQEKTGATMWARYLLCAMGFAVLYRLLMRWIQGVQAMIARTKQRLALAYMPRVLPYLVASSVWRALALAVLAGCAALVFTQLVYPVYVFPNYVPAVLVEPEEIIRTFWNVQSQGTSGVVYRTVGAVRTAYFAGLCRWGTVLTLYGVLRVRRGKEER